MKAAIISIGDELLSGKTINSNAAYISSQLISVGIPTVEVRTIGDNYYQIVRVLRELCSEVEIVIVTGGLGPTHDDVTKNAVSDFFRAKLVFHEDLFVQLKERFERTGKGFPESNREQAVYPDKAELISNSLGTAQGMIFKHKKGEVFVLPGVPSEMKAMLKETVIPRLKLSGKGFIDSLTLRTTGITESAIYDRLKEWVETANNVSVAFLPDLDGVDIRLTAYAESAADLKYRIGHAREDLYNELGEYIYTEGETNIEEVIAAEMVRRKLKLAIAESCTGGLIAHRFTNIPGSSDFFERGVVSYSNEAKVQILGVKESTIQQYGAVSSQTAGEMAEGIRRIAGTDIGLSVTGIAGPTGGTAEKPIGLVYFGLSAKEQVITWKRIFGEIRFQNKRRFSQAALDMLRRYLFYGFDNLETHQSNL